jgi:zinc protease
MHFLIALLAAAPALGIDRFQLENGLTVVLARDPGTADAVVCVDYRVGTADEPEQRSGLTSLLTQMAYRRAGRIDKPAAAVAGLGGQPYGVAAFDYTGFRETVPASELPAALRIESERMRSFASALTQAAFDEFRPIAVSRTRRSIRFPQTWELALSLTYGSTHPYRNGVEGDRLELQAATLDDALELGRRFTPVNAVLVVAGNFDPAVARHLIQREFARIPKGTEAVRPAVRPVEVSQVSKANTRELAPWAPRFELIWPNDVRPFSEDDAAGEVLRALLVSGRSSRLYRALVATRLVSAAEAVTPTSALGGRFSIAVVGFAGGKGDDLGPALQAELTRLRREGPTQAELEIAIRKVNLDELIAVQTLEGRAESLAQYEIYGRGAAFSSSWLATVNAVTIASVQAFVRDRLPDDRHIELTTWAGK